jgi:pyruvate/2-oxoglutarate dehydrogenase complex dihydrolipoamide acyltransferase (E2) component
MATSSNIQTETILTFTLPDIGEGVAEGEIMAWLVEEGQAVQEDQALVEVMTDKVTVEIPAPRQGIVLKRYAQVGDVLPVGSPLVDLYFGDADTMPQAQPQAPASSTLPAQKETKETAPSHEPPVLQEAPKTCSTTLQTPPSPVAYETQIPIAAPATRQLAKNLGVDLHHVQGTGKFGRITPDDVHRFSSTSKSRSFTIARPITPAQTLPYSGIRKKIGERLLNSTQNIPSFAYVDEIRMDKLQALRSDLKTLGSKQGIKITPLTFVLRATALALQEFPQLNSRLNEEETQIQQFRAVNLGIAVDTPNGLVVPVVPNAEKLSLFELAEAVQTLGESARAGKLTAKEMQGGTFTVSSIGSIGGLMGIPIINAPEVAILGVNQVRKVPVVNDKDEIVVGQVMNLSISADHRIVDGADTARFINRMKAYLESPVELLF